MDLRPQTSDKQQETPGSAAGLKKVKFDPRERLGTELRS